MGNINSKEGETHKNVEDTVDGSHEPKTTQDMGNLANQAPVSVSSLSSWLKLSKLNQGLAITPLWDLAKVKERHDEIQNLVRSGTSAPPLGLPPIDCFTKAAHMVQWYANTVKLWELTMQNESKGTTFTTRRKISDGLTDFLTDKQLSDLLGIYFALAEFGLMEKFCKWSSATLWAATLRQKELPPIPDFVSVCGLMKYRYMNVGSRWVNLCKQVSSDKYKKRSGFAKLMMIIAKDIYTTKSASLPVDDHFIEENLDKHEKILCQPHLHDPLTPKFEKLIKKAIEQCSDDIFGPLPVQDDHTIIKINKRTGITKVKEYKVPLERLAPSRLPSLGASVRCGRGKGGACGDLLTKHGEDYLLPEPEEGYLHSYCSYKTNVCDVRTPHDPELFREAEKSSRSHSYSKDSVQAQVVPLLEAFKVRTITKGDADQYHLARRWQSVIHSRMRKQLNCKLIGQPCDSAFLSQIFGNSPFFSYNEEGFFVSGDYESATDLLHPHLSEFANEAICQRLRIPLEDQLVLKRCLTDHELKYTAKGQYKKQQWGQLMGSPTSFPILCLINLAATKVAYEEFFRTCGMLKRNEYLILEELPMCVNGDDILFWCYDGVLYDIWKEVTKACGLKFSLGKNYTHNRVAIINSQMYFYNKEAKLNLQKQDRSHSHIHPDLLFVLARTVNARLLAGGTRAETKALQGLDVRNLTDGDLYIYGQYYKSAKENDLLSKFRIQLSGKQEKEYKAQTTHEGQLRVLRDIQRKDPTLKADLYATYLKFRSTIEQRGEKGLSLLRGSLTTAYPTMKEEYLKVFNNIQLHKLDRFRICGLEGMDMETPYFLPQSLGGLGLTPTNDHKYTAQDYVEVAALEGCPVQGERWVNKQKPTPVRPSMMKAVAVELALHKELLAIESVRKTREQIGLARFFGEDDSFWEHSFLTGFVTATNTIVGQEELGDATRFLGNNTRNFKNRQLMAELKRQRKTGCALGLWKLEKNLNGKRERVVKTAAYEEGFEIDLKSIELTYKCVPSPKYE